MRAPRPSIVSNIQASRHPAHKRIPIHPIVIIPVPTPGLTIMLGLGIILGLGRTLAKGPPTSVGAVSRGIVVSVDVTGARVAELSVGAP
jgi:hypothetical protein